MVKSMAAALLLALAAAGCAEEEAPVVDERPEKQGEAVAILRSFPAAPSGGALKESLEVIRDAKAWATQWAIASSHLAPVPREPKVDFAKEMVAFAALGEKRTAGHSVQVVGARKVDGKLRILYAVREPSGKEPAAQVITRPWHAVVLPASDLPVEWVRYEAPKPPPPKAPAPPPPPKSPAPPTAPK